MKEVDIGNPSIYKVKFVSLNIGEDCYIIVLFEDISE